MNRKLHNTVTALAATTGLLVLSLMAAHPVQMTAEPFEAEMAQARHARDAAQRIESRAALLQSRLAQSRDHAEAIGEIAGFAAEAATLATIAAAFDEAESLDAAAETTTSAKPRKRAAAGRQSVSMPYFSFAPRG
jgi:hypothetical protein